MSGIVILKEAERKAGYLDNDDVRPTKYSDEALALRYADKYSDELRYVAAWHRWFIWDGKRWCQDETLRAFDFARQICRVASAECSVQNVANALASAKCVAAVERLAKVDRRLASSVDNWDTDEWALNTPDGVVDLRTGKIRLHQPVDYITKITTVGPGGSCPLWLAFLNRVTDGDVFLQNYLQVLLGYSLTGSTNEHALFFFWGTGANGKSVLLSTIAGVFGDYHRTAPIETFITSFADRHPTDLARLRGARLVTSTETEEGRQWAEAKIKTLVAGDKIPARFMRQDFFEYTPHFKLIFAGNHKPGLRSVDEAIRRRFHLVPFAVTIPPDERDKNLSEKLRVEWPGILAWMIEGCQMWQAQGLRAPEVVLDATEDYLASEDLIGSWIEECCKQSPNAFETTDDLFRSWTTFMDKAGEPSGTMKSFKQRLEQKGYAKDRNSRARGYRGLDLKRNLGE